MKNDKHTCSSFTQIKSNYWSDLQWKLAKKQEDPFPTGICLSTVNSGNTRAMREICSKLTIKIPERRQWRRSGVFFVKFEQIWRIALALLLSTLNKKKPRGLTLLDYILSYIKMKDERQHFLNSYNRLDWITPFPNFTVATTMPRSL